MQPVRRRRDGIPRHLDGDYPTSTRSLREMWRGLGIRHHSDGQTTGRYPAPQHDDHHRQYLGVAMTALPEAVEQAIRELVFAAHDTGLFASDKYVRFEIEQADALRSAILAYGAARERQGIERAAAFLVGSEVPTTFTGHLASAGWSEATRRVAAMVRALPVDGATP